MGEMLQQEVSKILPAVLVISGVLGATVGGLIISALRGYGWLKKELETITGLISETIRSHELKEETRFDGFDRKLDQVTHDMADLRERLARIEERTK